MSALNTILILYMIQNTLRPVKPLILMPALDFKKPLASVSSLYLTTSSLVFDLLELKKMLRRRLLEEQCYGPTAEKFVRFAHPPPALQLKAA